VLVILPANIGYWLQRLDRSTGKPLWSSPPLLALPRLDAEGWALDKVAVYHTQGPRLVARSLADGKLLWERALPRPGPQSGGDWRIECSGYSVVAWPVCNRVVQFRFRWLYRSLQWQGGQGPVEGSDWAILSFDTQTGQLIQRLNFEARGTISSFGGMRRAGLHLWPSLRVETAARSSNPGVQSSGSSVFVSLGSRLWSLR